MGKEKLTQKVHIGASTSSKVLDANTTEDTIELSFPAEKISMVTTGDLVAVVTGILGPANITIGGASTTPSTVSPSHMFAGVKVVRTSGEGQLLILAK